MMFGASAIDKFRLDRLEMEQIAELHLPAPALLERFTGTSFEGAPDIRTGRRNTFVGNFAVIGGLIYVATLGPGGIALADFYRSACGVPVLALGSASPGSFGGYCSLASRSHDQF